MTVYQLAEINVARVRAPLDDPSMADFANNLGRINALAENAPGFVWRLVSSEAVDVETLRVFGDPCLIPNLSVWNSLEQLHTYTYASDHTDFFRRRREWFIKMDTPHLACWWVPEGHLPTLAEAKAKLDHLQAHGPTPQAFTLKHNFPAEALISAE